MAPSPRASLSGPSIASAPSRLGTQICSAKGASLGRSRVSSRVGLLSIVGAFAMEGDVRDLGQGRSSSPGSGSRTAARAVPRSAPSSPRPLQRAASSSLSSSSSDLSDSLSLENVRANLALQADSLLFALNERALWAANAAVYTPGALPVAAFRPSGERVSLFERMFKETERLHGRFRRYTSPDEHSFYFPKPSLVGAAADLAGSAGAGGDSFAAPQLGYELELPPLDYGSASPLHAACESVCVNAEVLSLYFDVILPRVASHGSDDGNYGSTVLADIAALQVISKRVHYGKFVAEIKFREETERYSALIRAKDRAGILEALTNQAVEDRNVQTVRHRAALLQRTEDAKDPRAARVTPDLLADLYEQWIMPLTKEVEVQYLLKRLDG